MGYILRNSAAFCNNDAFYNKFYAFCKNDSEI